MRSHTFMLPLLALAALAAADPSQSFCATAPQSGWVFCNPSAALDDRAADIVGRLSLADKINATVSSSPALPSVGLPAYQWWSEAT